MALCGGTQGGVPECAANRGGLQREAHLSTLSDSHDGTHGGCRVFLVCKQTLPFEYRQRPTARVQKELKKVKEEDDVIDLEPQPKAKGYSKGPIV